MIHLHLATETGPATLAYAQDGGVALLVLPERAAELTADQCLALARRLRNAALVLGAAEIVPDAPAVRLRSMGVVPALSVVAGGMA